MSVVGSLRNLITLREPTETVTTDGQVTRTYADAGAYLAECTVMGGGEMLRGQQVEAIVPTVFRIRYPHREPSVGPKWRVLWDGSTYEVDTIQDRDGRRRWLHLICLEVL